MSVSLSSSSSVAMSSDARMPKSPKFGESIYNGNGSPFKVQLTPASTPLKVEVTHRVDFARDGGLGNLVDALTNLIKSRTFD